MQFSVLYGQQLDIELGSADRSQLFTTARRQKAINDAMHNFERITSCTPVLGTIPVTATITTRINGIATVVTIKTGGTGYSVNDILTFSGGTLASGGAASQLKVTTVSSGVITAVSLQTAGLYTAVPASPIAVTGGAGSGATFSVSWDGTQEYDLLANFPNYISFQDRREPAIKRVTSTGAVIYITGTDQLSRRTPHWLDEDSPGWQADPAGVPNGWYIRDDSGTTFLGFDPPPDQNGQAETWTIYVPYLSLSTDMAADTDLPFTVAGKQFAVLVPYHQALVHYAAGLLEPLRKNYTGAQRQMGLYAGYIAQYETKKRKDGPNQITMRRNYFKDSGRPNRPVDPHRFP